MANPAGKVGSCSPLRNAVWERDGARCQKCGKKDLRREKVDRYDSGHLTGYDLGEIDHIIARADGGLTVIENLQLLCVLCNRRKAGQAARVRQTPRQPKRPRYYGYS